MEQNGDFWENQCQLDSLSSTTSLSKQSKLNKYSIQLRLRYPILSFLVITFLLFGVQTTSSAKIIDIPVKRRGLGGISKWSLGDVEKNRTSEPKMAEREEVEMGGHSDENDLLVSKQDMMNLFAHPTTSQDSKFLQRQ